MHASLTELFASHTYVGLVDVRRRIVALQVGLKLFLVDYGMLCSEYFYQVGLTDFGNFGVVRFAQPLSVSALVSLAVDAERKEKQRDAYGDEDAGDAGIRWDEVPRLVSQQLVQRREMLLEYFCLEVSAAGDLLSIPLLVKGYTPSLAKLPRFLMRLGPCVDWSDEKACFHTFLVELAAFYVPEQLPLSRRRPEKERQSAEGEDVGDVRDGDGNVGVEAEQEEAAAERATQGREEIAERKEELARMLEHVLFPAFRARLIATRGLLKGVVEVANLKGLYRVFERC
ncbi:MAG: hypothetical protein Q9187_009727 [Circinaria calcarea]